jgi:urease accessory protein
MKQLSSTNKSTVQYISLLLLLGTSGTASAHAGHDATGLLAGLLHPFSGMDHLLAMLAVGLWAAHSGMRKLWQLLATFMLLLIAGAGTALLLPSLPLVETGIAASVLVLGLITALSLNVPTALSIALTAAFGLVHGYAHGVEMPGTAEPVLYALGFLAATAALHFSGVSLGLATRGRFADWAQVMGAAIALSGVWMLS